MESRIPTDTVVIEKWTGKPIVFCTPATPALITAIGKEKKNLAELIQAVVSAGYVLAHTAGKGASYGGIVMIFHKY